MLLLLVVPPARGGGLGTVMKVAFFISDHGYGHIMRNLPVAEELIARGHEVTIVTGKSQVMVADQYLQGKANCIALHTDAGFVVYTGTLTIDVESTINAVKENIAKWPDMIAQAADLCADAFVVDIVPCVGDRRTGCEAYARTHVIEAVEIKHVLHAAPNVCVREKRSIIFAARGRAERA